MVEHTGEYRWFSNRANALGKERSRVASTRRLSVFRKRKGAAPGGFLELFRVQIDPNLVDRVNEVAKTIKAHFGVS